MLDTARVYGDVLVEIEKLWLALLQPQPPAAGGEPPSAPRETSRRRGRAIAAGTVCPTVPPAVPTEECVALDCATQNELGKLRKAVDELKVNSPAAPPRAMVLNSCADATSSARICVATQPASIARCRAGLCSSWRRSRQAVCAGERSAGSWPKKLLDLTTRSRQGDRRIGCGCTILAPPLVRTPGDFGMPQRSPHAPAVARLSGPLVD